MEATILARLPYRRYKSVFALLNGKIGVKDFTHKDFISEILGHYEMFVEPFKNRQARENHDGRERERENTWRSIRRVEKEVGAHLKESATSVESKAIEREIAEQTSTTTTTENEKTQNFE